MRESDEKYLNLAIKAAEKSFERGDYPVGAILVSDDKILGHGSNSGESSRSYVNHAETRLIIDNGEALLKDVTTGHTVTLYSTLEPCLMCLGMAAMNKVNRIVYIQADPHAGACGISKKSLGVRYQEIWPEIIHNHYSARPKELIEVFLNQQIAHGIRVEWSQKLLKLLAV